MRSSVYSQHSECEQTLSNGGALFAARRGLFQSGSLKPAISPSKSQLLAVKMRNQTVYGGRLPSFLSAIKRDFRVEICHMIISFPTDDDGR